MKEFTFTIIKWFVSVPCVIFLGGQNDDRFVVIIGVVQTCQQQPCRSVA